jgi:membrane protein DedA with SNARE-associated domain
MEGASFILDIAYQWSYLGIFGIALIANAFPGIPEEVFILALGYLGATSNFSMVLIGLVALAGMFISDCVIFSLSRGGARFYQKIAEKLFGKDDVDKMSQSSIAKRHIHKIIFFSRFVVQVRFLGPFLAGMYQVSWKKFLFFDTLALLVYIPLALFLGSYFQGRMEQILSGSSIIGNYMLILVVVIAIFVVVRAIRKGFIKRLTGGDHVKRVKSFFGFSKIEEDEKK